MFARIKTLSFKLISIGIGLFMGLVLGECGIRYYWYGTNGFSYTSLNSFKSLGRSGLIQRAANDSILWELQPNLDTLFKFRKFSTNSLGMRDIEYPMIKPGKTKRIVVIGDSFAMGSGVHDQENYSSVLECLFDNELADFKVEVLNFGVGGYGLRNYDAVLRNKAMNFDPDLVIVGFCGGNDFLIPSKQQIDGELKIHPPLEMFYTLQLKKFFRHEAKQNRIRQEVPVPNQNQRRYMTDHLVSIKEQCDDRGIPLLLAYYSLNAPKEVVESVRELNNNLGIQFLNAGAGLEGVDVDELIFHKLDAHPNARTHKVYAQNIFEKIRAEKFLAD